MFEQLTMRSVCLNSVDTSNLSSKILLWETTTSEKNA